MFDRSFKEILYGRYERMFQYSVGLISKTVSSIRQSKKENRDQDERGSVSFYVEIYIPLDFPSLLSK